MASLLNLDPGAVARYITNAAIQRGIDPNIALRVWRGEGAGGYVGDNGTSFGDYQLHYGVPGGRGFNQPGLGNDFTAATGFDARNPDTRFRQIDFALDKARQGGWGPWYGAAKAGITGNAGINSAPMTLGPSDTGTMPMAKGGATWPTANSGGLLSGINTNQQQGLLGGGLGPMLLALGAGIAGGSTQGWGSGIGQGLALAQQQQQNDLERQLKLAELKQSIGYQNATLQNAVENTKVLQGQRQDALDIKADEAKRRQAEIAGPLSLITAGAPQYQKAKENILSGRWKTATGSGTTVIQNMLLGAAKINGDDPQKLFETMLPNALDSQDARASKLQLFEQYMSSLKPLLSQGYPAFSDKLKAFDAFSVPTPNPGETLAPKGAAPVNGPPVEAGAASSGAPTRITNEQEYNSLPAGALYIDPTGKLRTKQ